MYNIYSQKKKTMNLRIHSNDFYILLRAVQYMYWANV